MSVGYERVSWFFTHKLVGSVPWWATMTELRVGSHPTYPAQCSVLHQPMTEEGDTDSIGLQTHLRLKLKAGKSDFPHNSLGRRTRTIH